MVKKFRWTCLSWNLFLTLLYMCFLCFVGFPNLKDFRILFFKFCLHFLYSCTLYFIWKKIYCSATKRTQYVRFQPHTVARKTSLDSSNHCSSIHFNDIRMLPRTIFFFNFFSSENRWNMYDLQYVAVKLVYSKSAIMFWRGRRTIASILYFKNLIYYFLLYNVTKFYIAVNICVAVNVPFTHFCYFFRWSELCYHYDFRIETELEFEIKDSIFECLIS